MNSIYFIKGQPLLIYLNSFGEDLRSPLQRIILYRNNFDRECRRYCFIKPDYEASSYFITQIVTIRHQRLSTNLDRYISASGPIINSKYRILHCAGRVTDNFLYLSFSSKPSPVWNTLLHPDYKKLRSDSSGFPYTAILLYTHLYQKPHQVD